MDLTFGEQILLLLKRKNMTIPEYAQLLEERTGIPCSSQYLNQQLKKDNFLEHVHSGRRPGQAGGYFPGAPFFWA